MYPKLLLANHIDDTIRMSDEERAYELKLNQRKRARIALDLALWASLMWDSPWMGRLCPCSIAVQRFERGDDLLSFLKDSALPSFAGRRECRCSRNVGRQWRLLGLVLAELVTGRIYEVSWNSRGQALIWVAEGEREMERTQIGDILLDVANAASASYYRAVQECLASDMATVDNPSKAVCARYITDRVVGPLAQWHNVLRRRRERLPRVYGHTSG